MKYRLKKIYRFFLTKKLFFLFILFLLLGILLSFSCGILANIIGVDLGYIESENKLIQIAFAIILSPFIETAIFQHFVINLLGNYKKSATLYKIAISAISFGLLHIVYSFYYFISAFLFGIVLATCFIIFQKRKKQGFFYTFLLHAIVNLLATI